MEVSQSEAWERFYEFTGTTLQDYPLPAILPLERGRELDMLGREAQAHDPVAVFSSRHADTAEELDLAQVANREICGRG